MDTWQYRLMWSWYPSLSRTAQEIQWMGLIILKTGIDSVDPKIESVEFAAFHKTKNTLGQIHENSRFIHERGQWYYLDGDLLAPLEFGRNDPCWSGSNKKFKKCHGRWCVEYFQRPDYIFSMSVYSGLLKNLSNASIKTPSTVVPFLLAYRSIRSIIWQGNSAVNFCVGSAHWLALMSSGIMIPFYKGYSVYFPWYHNFKRLCNILFYGKVMSCSLTVSVW